MVVIGTYTDQMLLEYLKVQLNELCADIEKHDLKDPVHSERILRQLDCFMACLNMVEDLTGMRIKAKLTGVLIADGEEYR